MFLWIFFISTLVKYLKLKESKSNTTFKCSALKGKMRNVEVRALRKEAERQREESEYRAGKGLSVGSVCCTLHLQHLSECLSLQAGSAISFQLQWPSKSPSFKSWSLHWPNKNRLLTTSPHGHTFQITKIYRHLPSRSHGYTHSQRQLTIGVKTNPGSHSSSTSDKLCVRRAINLSQFNILIHTMR